MATESSYLRNSIDCTFATVMWENCSVLLGMLHLFDPNRFMATFRQHIYRSAGELGLRVQGQLFAALHGAYDPTTQTYPIHIHLMARGGMVPIVDGLRMLRIYAPAQPWDGRDAANTPVWMSRDTPTNMPDPLTYILKRYWLTRATYMDTDGFRKAYGGKRGRLPEPAHTEVLQFLDRWRLEDMTLLMGMHVTKEGLMLNR